jgi:hypothetical protein
LSGTGSPAPGADTTASSPCRLFVYLARDRPLAVILRRGPTEWARLSLWHTETDTFEHGQWIKGRVYERRSDLSQDGALFAAFIRQSGGRPGQAPAASDTWVALSKPPYFSALAVWFIGGTYYTGAFFPRPQHLWLGFMDEQPPDIGSTPDWLTVAAPRDIAYIDGTAEWTERTVHFNRLLRDGWTLVDRDAYATMWSKQSSADGRVLTMLQVVDDFRTFGGPYVVEYSMRDASGGDHALGRGTWADWDQHGRLVMARDGCLYTWTTDNRLEQLADLNDQRPDPRPAPEWATRW